MGKNISPCPSEDTEQQMLIRWADMVYGKYPELRLLFHIPNGGSRHKAEAVKFKLMGVRPGVPDLFLPVPRGGYCGLFIEMKRQRAGYMSEDQRRWQRDLEMQGYAHVLARGFDAARAAIIRYLEAK